MSEALSAVCEVIFAFRRVTLFLLAQKKVTKEKATPLPLVSFG
jgi:hypothetical protein